MPSIGAWAKGALITTLVVAVIFRVAAVRKAVTGQA